MSRRDFLRGTGKVTVLGALAGAGLARPRVASADKTRIESGVWVWQFTDDGDLKEIRRTLSDHNLPVILKTHDGTTWMSKFDTSPDAVSGPDQVTRLALTFESARVHFHAWCVVRGEDPILEARMCADVLRAGARSLYLDLEPADGDNYWQGTGEDALTFGRELRRLAPDERIILAPDSRPWQAGRVPMAEFMSFSNAVAPQAYWETFQSPANQELFAQHGHVIGPEGVTPEIVLEASVDTFKDFGRPINPIGEGASDPDKWRRFLDAARAHDINGVTLWRYGGSDRAAFDVLHEVAPDPFPLEAASSFARSEYSSTFATMPQATTENYAREAHREIDTIVGRIANTIQNGFRDITR